MLVGWSKKDLIGFSGLLDSMDLVLLGVLYSVIYVSIAAK